MATEISSILLRARPLTVGVDLGKDNVSFGGDEPRRSGGVTEAFFPQAAVAIHREPEGDADRHKNVGRIALSGLRLARAEL